MAFALTSFFADGQEFNGPGLYRGIQTYCFNITGTTADVALDIGTYAGTFWTAALADATYGSVASTVLTQIKLLNGQIRATSRVYTPELQSRIQAAATSGSAYTLSIDSTTFLPIYTFAASNGATAYTVFVQFLLLPNIQPSTFYANIG